MVACGAAGVRERETVPCGSHATRRAVSALSVMEAVALVALALLFVLLLKMSGKTRQERMLQGLPGPPGWPVIGNALDLAGSPQKQLRVLSEWDQRFGPMYKTWYGQTPIVHLSSPQFIQAILDNPKHAERGTWNVGHGSTPLSHKIQPPGLENVAAFLDTFSEKSKILQQQLTRPGWCDVCTLVKLCALDIICETVLGCDIKAQLNEHSKYVQSIIRINELLNERRVKMTLCADLVFARSITGIEYQRHMRTLRDFVEERLKTTENRRKRKPFIDIVLDSAKGKGQTIADDITALLLEGHEKLTAAINWTLYLISLHEAVQEHAFQEQVAIFQGDSRPASMSDLGKMNYLERVIKEALRLHPVVPVITRRIEGDTEVGPCIIPHGTTVYLHINRAHRSAAMYQAPEQFNPDNFKPDKLHKRHPYSYLPFSRGTRTCPGQKFALVEEKVVLSSILRNFKVESAEGREDLTLVNELTPRSKCGIKIRVVNRKLVKEE